MRIIAVVLTVAALLAACTQGAHDGGQLGDEQPCVAVQHLEIAGGAAPIAQVRESAGIGCRDDERFLRFACLAATLIRHQRVGHFTQRLQHGRLIRQRGFLGLRLGEGDA